MFLEKISQDIDKGATFEQMFGLDSYPRFLSCHGSKITAFSPKNGPKEAFF